MRPIGISTAQPRADAVLIKTSLSTDSVLRKTMVAQLNTDAVLKKKSLDEFAADAVLQIIYGVAGADAILKRLGITNQILVDAMLP